MIIPLPPDIKRITAILNKISDDNYDRMVEEAKTFNYADAAVVSTIFKKILEEPGYSGIYARFCGSLVDLHAIINETCIVEFNKAKCKHKNLGRFIGELYKLDLLDDLHSFLGVLLDHIDETKLETLCQIITTIGVKDRIFDDIKSELGLVKAKFNKRYQFMILDILEERQRE